MLAKDNKRIKGEKMPKCGLCINRASFYCHKKDPRKVYKIYKCQYLKYYNSPSKNEEEQQFERNNNRINKISETKSKAINKIEN